MDDFPRYKPMFDFEFFWLRDGGDKHAKKKVSQPWHGSIARHGAGHVHRLNYWTTQLRRKPKDIDFPADTCLHILGFAQSAPKKNILYIYTTYLQSIVIWYITALNTKIIVESWNFIPFPTYPMAILGAARCSNTVRVSIRSPMALEMAKLALKTWNHKWSHNGTWYSDRVSSSLLSSPWRPGSCGDGWTYLSIHCCPWKLGDQWMNNGWMMDDDDDSW